MALLNTLFHIDLGPYCWSIGLIGLGIWLVMRPRMVTAGMGTHVSLIGEVRRNGLWTVRDEEFWLGVNDVELDLSRAVVPSGQTTLRFYTFVSEVKIFVPRGVGVSVRAAGFVVDSDLLGQEENAIFSPVEIISPDYQTSASRLRIEITGFVANIKVRQE
jgi:lia operon protein LiaF